jgi:hypothetical protein
MANISELSWLKPVPGDLLKASYNAGAMPMTNETEVVISTSFLLPPVVYLLA